jgi:transposase
MIGPGEYVPDITEGIRCVEDLPEPKVVRRSRNYPSRTCPRCGQRAGRRGIARRTLHDLGDVLAGRPVDLVITYSKHKCPHCHLRFTADMTDLALPKCLYTKQVQNLAVRLVAEDGLPYRSASWHLWRDHRVFVPYATIQNWVEAAGEKKSERHADHLPGRGPGWLQRLPGH